MTVIRSWLRRSLRCAASRLGVCLLLAPLATCCYAQQPDDDLREILALDGWNEDAWKEFADGKPLSADEISDLLPLLQRLHSFGAHSIDRWTRKDGAIEEVIAEPSEFHTQLVAVRGQLRELERHEFSAEDAERVGFNAYHLGQVHLNDNATATVLAADMPLAWRSTGALEEPVSFAGLFVKRASAAGEPPRPVFVAPRIRWHPTRVAGANDSFGWAVLGSARFDLGLLDTINQRARIRPQEREAFYQLLAAAGAMNPERLAHHAQKNLPRWTQSWRPVTESSSPRQLLARTVMERATEGRYSVAPLFNEPADEVGNLFVLEGVARRAVRIEVARAPDGGPSDVWQRFQIDHYFELDIFTDDSQSYPIVFCVQSLPDGFPTGAKIHEPVRVAGFFLKSWLHDTRRGAVDASASEQQFAPLLIGAAPLWRHADEGSASVLPSLAAGVLFVLALAGIWGFAWWHGRSDRRFHARAIQSQYTLPQNVSLDDIIPEGIGEPDFSGWSAATAHGYHEQEHDENG